MDLKKTPLGCFFQFVDKKAVRNAFTPNHDYKTRPDYTSCFFPVILIRLKKFATLLPNNWLAGTPQPLAARRLGRQSAEREWISEINWNGFKKTVGKLALCGFLWFYETLTRLKKFATLLPNNWLVETPQALAARRLGRQSAERERISEINWNGF